MNNLVPADTVPLRMPLILSDTRRRVRAGVVAVAVAFGGGGAFAALAPLNAAAIATGTVGADGSNKVVQHLEGGIISSLSVKEGQQVQEHQVLMTLENTRAKAAVDELTGQWNALRAAAARLTAERDHADHVAFPDDLLKQRATDPDINRILTGQEQLFQARRFALDGERSVLKARLQQYNEEIVGLDAQRQAAEGQINLLEEEARVVRALVAVGQATKPRLLALERDEQRLQGDRGNSIAQAARARQNIGETLLHIDQLDLDRLNEVANDLRDTETKVYDTAEKMRAASDVLTHTVITAPVSGTVVKLDVHTVGGVVQAGEQLMEIVPSDDRMLIDAHLKPTDIASVKVGQTAEVRLDAYSQRRTPMVLGHVTNVSADALHDRTDGPSYYVVRVAVDKDSLDKLPNVQLYPGMPAEVMVVTGERSLLNYVIMPIASSLRHAFIEQ